MILTHRPSTRSGRKLPAIARAAAVLSFALLLLPHAGVMAEAPLAPSEIRLAGMQPLIEGMAEGTKEAAPTPAEPAAQAPAPAQTATGTVSGTVTDQTGAVVPGVIISLAGTTARNQVVTNEVGRYVFPQVQAGQYTLQARLPGFTAASRTVSVAAGSTSVQDVALRLAGVNTQVEVSTRRVPVEPSTPRPPAPPPPVRVGGDVAQPTLVYQLKPVYPAAARNAGIQDYVQLQGVIGRDGIVHSLQVDTSRPGSANAELTKAAIESVQQWRYRPGMLNGIPVEIATTITVNFSLVD